MKPREYFINLDTGEITKKDAKYREGELITRGKKYADKASRFIKKGDSKKACEIANLGIQNEGRDKKK